MKTSTKGATLLVWHSVGRGIGVLSNTIELLLREGVRVVRVVYLAEERYRQEISGVEKHAAGAEVEIVWIPLSDPTHHDTIYRMIQQRVLPKVRHVPALHINISPGTPAMHAVWLVLHAAGSFPAGTRLWSAQIVDKALGTTRIDPVAFELPTYLAEIRRITQNKPERAAYDPDPRSPARRDALQLLQRFARVPGAPILVLGERGTGKTTIVETYLGTLKQRHVVPLACGTLDGADTRMAESELFGHVKDAFTGATKAREGLVARAKGGVLMLDEVQDLPKVLQRKLVRLLQDARHRYRPVGGDEELEADIDIVCASNLSIEELRMRLDADLFDRIGLLTVRIPPLRECREDLPEDWQSVWRSLRRNPSFPEHAPSNRLLLDALATAPLWGNLRDLQRLALLVMAFWSDHDEAAFAPALEVWQKQSDIAPTLQPDLGSGSRKARIVDFRRRLATWAKETWGTWARAAEALECDEKTLREDVG